EADAGCGARVGGRGATGRAGRAGAGEAGEAHSGPWKVIADGRANPTPDAPAWAACETTRPQLGHWYNRRETSSSRGGSLGESAKSRTRWRSSTISRRDRRPNDDPFSARPRTRGSDVRAGPDL